jgi:primosomal protein N' (replication factor Y)
MDADTVTAKSSYDKMLDDFRCGRADVLLGTQMVTKGHDFPRVSLVGVLLADSSLYVSDFRASERTFSLLTQVIGRAGRAGTGGRAVIQTFSPDNDVIALACRQDYDSFYEREIQLRRSLSFPPFCDMVQVTLSAEDEQTLASAAKAFADECVSLASSKYSDQPMVIFGPHEAQTYKAQEKYRMRLIIKCRLNKKTREYFSHLLCKYAQKNDIALSLDFNPTSV